MFCPAPWGSRALCAPTAEGCTDYPFGWVAARLLVVIRVTP